MCYSESADESISFENNKLSSIENRSGAGAGFRIIKNKKIGFSFTTNPEKIKEAAGYALESSKFGEKAGFVFPKKSMPLHDVKMSDQKVKDFDLKSLIPLGNKIIKKISSKIKDAVVSIGFDKGEAEGVFLNSSGVFYAEDTTDFSCGVSINVTHPKAGLISLYESKSRANLYPIEDIEKMAEIIIQKYSASIKPAVIKAGNYPVIFNKYSIGFLFSCILEAVNGKIFQKGISPLSDKLGKKILDSRISIYDDPAIDYLGGSYIFDGEGLPAYKKPLIEEGVFKNFIFDLRTASLVKAKPTANAGRSFSSQPAPSFGNIVISAGDTPYKDMIKNLDEGIIIEQVIGAGQSNTLAGDVSVNVDMGYLVKNGKIKGRVKDCMIAANVYDIFKNIQSISSDLFVKSSMITPAICFNKINVAV